MEASDTFGAGVESPADDPFAQSDDEFQQEDPLGEPEAGSLPLVDKEGQVISDSGTAIEPSEQEMLAEAERAREEEAAAAAVAEPPAAEPQPELPSADPTSPASSSEATTAVAGAEPDPTSPSTNQGTGESGHGEPDPTAESTSSTEPGAAAGGEHPGSSPDPTNSEASAGEAGSGDGSEPDPTSGGTAATDAPEAEVPEEKKDKKGTVTHRRYMVLRPEGDGKWAEVHWHEKDGKVVPKGTQGAKKQKVCLARGQEEALGVGYSAVGSPPDGAPLVAIALTYFQLRHVSPDEPPIRQRLKIR